jgi:hypothetical protein
MTTSNKLEPTTSSILLAKRVAFPSALHSPINLSHPKPTTPPCTANKSRRMAMKRHIGKLEKIIRTVMVEPSFVSVRWERLHLIPTVSPEQVKPAARLNPILQKSRNFGGVPHPPGLLS